MKQLLKKLLLPVLTSRSVSSVATYFFGYGVPIFMMHRFVADNSSYGGHTPDFLRRCLQYLKDNGHTFVTVEDILYAIRDGKSLPHKPVAFTIDDGFINQATLAAPVFKEFNCPVTIFLISGMIDEQLWPWDDKVAYIIKNSSVNTIKINFGKESCVFELDCESNITNAISSIQNIIKTLDGESIPAAVKMLTEATGTIAPEVAPEGYRTMTWGMARELEKNGVSFAPHTVSHRILSKLGKKASETEIMNSWRRLKEELSSPVPIFCYPTGKPCDFGRHEINLLKNSGFLGAVSTVPTYVDLREKSQNYSYNLPRFGLPDTFDDFIQYCTWIEHAKTKIFNR
jgi:peptidoglycan/xylan/chitin deacetylase (PgdA/CDA1 family)